jgi:hypothetical protein
VAAGRAVTFAGAAYGCRPPCGCTAGDAPGFAVINQEERVILLRLLLGLLKRTIQAQALVRARGWSDQVNRPYQMR